MTTPGGGDDPGARSALAALPSPLAAVDDMRSAAKWTLAAEGAVGAVLISGGPLLAVGQIHGVLNAILAGLGLLTALGGVGIATWSTTKVLAPRLVTPATLALPSLARFREVVEESPGQFFGVIATNVAGLLRYQEIAVNLARLLAVEKDPGRRAKIETQLRRTTRDATRADPFVRWLLTAAHAWLVEQELQRSRRFTLAGGVLVVAGAVLFFSVTGSSGPTYVPVLTPQITAVPSPIPSTIP